MGEEKAAQTSFKPYVVRTGNVAKELLSAAAANSLKASDLDFNLLSVQTFLLRTENRGDEEEIAPDEIGMLNDKGLMADPKVKIRQMYEIEIILYDADNPLDKLSLGIGANATMSRLFAAIKPDSYIEYYEGIREDLRRLITKRKLRAHMLIGFWNGQLESELDSFIARVQVNTPWKIEEKISLEVGCALEPVDTVDDAIVLHYERHAEENELAKVDHSKRGFVKGVKKDDVLIEYIKAKRGVEGRNCRGEFIDIREPVAANAPTFDISEKIELIETDDKIIYRARENGYITFENNIYDIKAEMEITEISFKTTGSIEAGMNTDVSINVKEADAFKDAIGNGMEVEVNELNVDGNVGNNAKIRAKKVSIEGQTHQSSYIEADEVKVGIHKGRIKGKKVQIARLEQGIVEAEQVEVTQASGGKIIAKEVLIDTLSSHVVIIASHKIEINYLKGEENSFTITPILYDEDREKLSSQEEEIVQQERKIRVLVDEAEHKKAILDENKNAIAELKKRLAHYKETGTKMPSAFVAKFKEFQELQANLQNIQTEIRQNEDKLALIQAKTNTLQSDIMEAKIINHSTYKGHNEIRFKLLDPELELYLVPKGHQDERCFVLYHDESNDRYEIRGSEVVE